jgi:hypothetical protein
MKALTLWQPWATLIAEGVKPFEFRRWPAPQWIWGQRIAIHAGARRVRPREIDDLIASLRLEEGWGTALIAAPALDILLRIQASPAALPLSSILCTAVIGRPLPAADAVATVYGDSFKGDSDRIDHQVFGWPITSVRRLEPPLPARGAQGFWNWAEIQL